jgi:hypothetical protein
MGQVGAIGKDGNPELCLAKQGNGDVLLIFFRIAI